MYVREVKDLAFPRPETRTTIFFLPLLVESMLCSHLGSSTAISGKLTVVTRQLGWAAPSSLLFSRVSRRVKSLMLKRSACKLSSMTNGETLSNWNPTGTLCVAKVCDALE